MEDRERDVEKYLRIRVERLGGMALKFVSPGNRGVPDRVVIIPGRGVHFVETKTEGGRLSHLQKWQQGRLKKRGASVKTIWTKEQVDTWLGGGDAR